MATTSALSAAGPRAGAGVDVELASLGALTPVSRRGGQGRVFAPAEAGRLAATPLVVKVYRVPLQGPGAATLSEMVAWGRGLPADERRTLYRLAAWPLATVSSEGRTAGMLMQDLRARFELPFRMPSGRVTPVMLQLEHLLGPDDYLQQRGQQQRLDTRLRAQVLERICAAFAFLHSHAIAVSDVSPSNLLIALRPAGPEVTLIDCDSMVFQGRQALAQVETGDWQIPPAYGERPLTEAADAYKLGLIVLRVFARTSDARALDAHRAHVPDPLHGLLVRALSAQASTRPSAGEWQRALRGLLADEHVMRRHPGPRLPVRSRTHTAATPAPERRIRARQPTAALAGSSQRHFGAPEYGAGGGRPSHWFTTAWLVVGFLVLLLFMHLLVSADFSPSGRGAYELRSAPSEYRLLRPGGAGQPAEPGRGEEGPRTAGPGEESSRTGEGTPSP